MRTTIPTNGNGSITVSDRIDPILTQSPKVDNTSANNENYFCCTHPLCARHKKLCDQQSPEVPQITTIYQKCTGDKDTTGLLVPEVLCDERARSGTGGEDTRVCCIPPKTDRLISHPNAAKLAKIPCGTIGLMVKIQDGTYAQRGEFPWMVYLVYKYKRTCSGTLIHPSYVLTAHHCVQPGLEKVRLGEYNLEEKSQCSPGEAAGEACSHVQEIAISQKFRNHAHDVGLLRLAQPASLDGDLVRPICLPLYLNLRLHVPLTVSITGWGLTEKGKPSNILMKAETQVVTKEKGCTNDYVICVGGHNNSNHCNGDSGGPYQAQGTFGGFNRFVQYGIISDGSRYCATPDRPSRAVLVAYVMEWILSKMVL
ncbi:kallikrein-13-like [Anopheles nili]|uniref:kallikrein-13-like n=1 Tax=Anopheles nili TaxID=185578 RepID=UPI00237A6CD7|nr:kallikrein-13-like [Anopheles nili]